MGAWSTGIWLLQNFFCVIGSRLHSLTCCMGVSCHMDARPRVHMDGNAKWLWVRPPRFNNWGTWETLGFGRRPTTGTPG